MVDNISIIESQNKDKSALFIQQAQAGVTKELLFKEFSKFGQLRHVRHFPKTNTALIIFENAADAEEAMINLNHTQILKKEILITYFQDKDVLSKYKKKLLLFLSNVPPALEISVLHNFLSSEFGDISSLKLIKKKNSEQNIGQGYVQFQKEEDFKKILQHQQNQGKITITNSDYSFTVEENSSEKQNTKTNKIHITCYLESEIFTEAKKSVIITAFEGVKKNLGDKQNISIHTEYEDLKKSFQTEIKFAYSNEEEDTIYQIVMESIVQNFKNTTLTGAKMIFRANESSIRNLICMGVKNYINETIFAAWLLRVLGIVIFEENIHIRLPYSAMKAELTNSSTYFINQQFQTKLAVLFFNSKKDGEKFLIFCSKPKNTHALKMIFENKHKVALFLNQEQLNKIKKQTTAKSNYNKGLEYQFWLPFQHNRKVNVFIQFQKLSSNEKRQQVEDISQKINSHRIEFDQIYGEEGKSSILGQIIYYKILNFGESNKAELINEFKKTSEEANSLITKFHEQVAKITGMLIDKESFSIEEIKQIATNPKELLERCLEAIGLLDENQQN